MKVTWRAVSAAFAVLIISLAAGAASAAEAKRSITKVAGDLYRFQNNFHVSVFLVTDAGVIATDPINADAAKWLKKEIAERFGKTVKYLIYSHDHRDHIAGGEVFADTAIVVAHDNAKADIIGEKRPTAVPDITFSDRMTIELGGQVVELSYLGRSHSDNMIVMRFPAERALFVVDIVAINRVGFRDLADAYFPDWLEVLRRVEALDFDILVHGHGPVGGKADIAGHRAYLKDLYDAVLAALRAGLSMDEAKASIKLEKYRDYGFYKEWRALNIEGMYNQLSLHRRGN